MGITDIKWNNMEIQSTKSEFFSFQGKKSYGMACSKSKSPARKAGTDWEFQWDIIAPLIKDFLINHPA